MSNVVNLSDHRKPDAVAKPAKVELFFCRTCDKSIFHLSVSGAVHCANCGSHIQNLKVHT